MTKRFKPLLLAALFLLPNLSVAGEVTLKPGESFGLRISGVPADEIALVSQQFQISDAGTIRLPYLKVDIKAAGLKPSALARKIENAYRTAEIYTAPTIQIDPQVTENKHYVSVLGEVRAPQKVELVPGMTLLDAIATCGSFTDFAKTKKVKLVRGKKVTYHNLSRGATKENVALLRNDIVTVP